jgi:hypothetical protein
MGRANGDYQNSGMILYRGWRQLVVFATGTSCYINMSLLLFTDAGSPESLCQATQIRRHNAYTLYLPVLKSIAVSPAVYLLMRRLYTHNSRFSFLPILDFLARYQSPAPICALCLQDQYR